MRQNFLTKCESFRYDSNNLTQMWVTLLNSPTLKTSGRVQEPGTNLLHKSSYNQFCVQNTQTFVTMATQIGRGKFE